jgi:5-methylcytosine-specific restriction enzyme A
LLLNSETAMALEEIRPLTRERMYDLVKAAGLDVSDWANYRRPAYPARNPRYCYEWSFAQEDRLVVLNLWYSSLTEEAASVRAALNLRNLAKSIARLLEEAQRGREVKPVWEKRTLKMDSDIQIAARTGLPVRVIVCDGEMRDLLRGDKQAVKARRRMLDPVPWAVTSYDWVTGDTVLTRGAQPMLFPKTALDVEPKATAPQKYPT